MGALVALWVQRGPLRTAVFPTSMLVPARVPRDDVCTEGVMGLEGQDRADAEELNEGGSEKGAEANSFGHSFCHRVSAPTAFPAVAHGLREEPEFVTARAGEGVVLRCDVIHPVTGQPPPYVVEWFKFGVPIPIFIKFGYYPPHVDPEYAGKGWAVCPRFDLTVPPPLCLSSCLFLAALISLLFSTCLFLLPGTLGRK